MEKKNTGRTFLLKIASILLGLAFWHIFTHKYELQTCMTIPICLDNAPTNSKISSPEAVVIKVFCTQNNILSLKENNCMLHVDASKLKNGVNKINIKHENFFLPPGVTLLNTMPSTILVYMHSYEEKDVSSMKEFNGKSCT